MIQRETIFVLGAGASCAYGFSTGAGLREEILDIGQKTGTDKRERLLGISPQAYKAFQEAFLDSGLSSIDSFLLKQAGRRDDLFDIGKKAIALHIGQREIRTELRKELVQGGWYRLLWHAMASELQHPEEILQNRVRFITFNYDRSLEYFLVRAIANSFALSEQDALGLVAKLSLSHVYGSLGALSLTADDTGRPYVPPASKGEIAEACKNIQLMATERRACDLADNIEWFKTADQVIFLGFGFDQENILRLGFRDAMAQRFTRDRAGQMRGKGLHIFATMKDIPATRQAQIIDQFLGARHSGVHWNVSQSSVVEALPTWNCLQ